MAIAGDPRPDRAGHHVSDEIHRIIPKLEKDRHALGGAMWRDAVLLSFGAAVAAAQVGVRGAEELVPAIVLAAIAAGAVLHARRRRQWRAALVEAVMPGLCRSLGLRRYRAAGDPAWLRDFEVLGLVAPSEHRDLSHEIEGRCGDTLYAAQHATLRGNSVSLARGRMMFHGLLMRVTVRLAPPVRILIVPAEDVGAIAGPSCVPFDLGHSAFEERLRVLTPPIGASASDQVKNYLTPRLLDALLAIDAEEGGGMYRSGLRAGFEGTSFYLALPRVDWPGIGTLRLARPRPFIEPGGILVLGNLEETIAQMAFDAATPSRIVDRLAEG